MAEANTPQERSLEELEREITCGICQEHYSEPKILPCLHYYCKQCVLRLALSTALGQPFSCPECRSEATLPEGGVDELKTAFFVNRLQTTVTTMERTHGKVEVKCELCPNSNNKAEGFCRQCARFICRNCVDLHKKIPTLENHDITSLDKLKQEQDETILVKEPPAKKCLVHEEPLAIYCYDCTSLICQHCAVKDHRDHNIEFTKKAASDEKLKLQKELQPLKDLHSKVANSVEQIQTTKLEVEKQRTSKLEIIKTSFNELHDILDRREKELTEEVERTVQEKARKLSAQEKDMSLVCAQIKNAVDYTEQYLKHSDYNVMSMLNEMRKMMIEKKTEEHRKSEVNLEPVEKADIALEITCAEILQQLCKTSCAVTSGLDLSKCSVQLEEPVTVGQVLKGTLTTRLHNNQIAKRNCKISCQLKSLHNRVTSSCVVHENKSGSYSIQCTPTIRGRHELTVLIDGQHVTDSPFPVFVFIHPTQLGKPVKVWKKIFKPIDVAVTTTGDILVTGRQGNVIKLSSTGKRENIRSLSQNKPKAICRITVDDEDNIYCSDENSNEVLICNENGSIVETYEIKKNGGPGIFIMNNEIFVPEACPGTIMVYDRDLKFKKCIHHKNMGLIVDMCADVHGNIYATDYSYSCIHMLTSTGDYLRLFGQGESKLRSPWGVHISGKYVYVTDISNDCVSVFTTDGAYVTSFGEHSQKSRRSRSPFYLHLCIDRDGFVCVSDYVNGQIRCF